MQQNNNNEYFGYSLFNDIEDLELRTRNRVATLKNIMEDHLGNDKQPTAKCGMLTYGYFSLIPDDERKSVYDGLESYFEQKKGVTQ